MPDRPGVNSVAAERDRLAAGMPLICCDERHEAKVRGLEAALDAAEVRRAEAAQLSHQYRNATERAEARIAAALAVVDRFDEYLLRQHAVADLRDALNGNSQSAPSSPQIGSWGADSDAG